MVNIILALIFLILSLLHVYWAFGGKWALEGVIPDIDGKLNEIPGTFLTLLVAFGLLAMGGFYFFQELYGFTNVDTWWVKYIKWIIPSIFLIRVIGDFKYVGLFKNRKEGLFAKRDTMIYVPLCVAISILGFLSAT